MMPKKRTAGSESRWARQFRKVRFKDGDAGLAAGEGVAASPFRSPATEVESLLAQPVSVEGALDRPAFGRGTGASSLCQR
jgi:hypothetical protein